MEIQLPFGGQFQRLDTADFGQSFIFGGRYSRQYPSPIDEAKIESTIQEGIKNYIRLFEHPKILTVVNDSYRRTPTAVLLPIIWDYIKNGDFIVATGTHRAPTEDELQAIFGEFYATIKPGLLINDCHDQDSHVKLGQTLRGTPVSLHRKIGDADMILTINSVEPHFFAGFTGGRKSIIPGLASFETVRHNHSLAKDINSCTLNLQTNPLHLDLDEGVRLLGEKPVFTIQCVTDQDGGIIELFAGELNDSFKKACSCAAEIYTVSVPKKYDVVIANCVPPLDGNLYQLQKAQEHGGRMVKPGGVLIVMGACPEGTGSEYFMKLAEKYPTPEAVLQKGVNDNSFGIHKLIKTARQLREFKIFYVTTLDDHEVKKVYFRSFKDIRMAMKSALKELGENIELAVLDNAGYSVPVIEP